MLVDSHCHLDFPDFDADRDDVVARARAAGVATMVTISTRVAKFARLKEIAAREPRVVAIGEAGLDYHYDKSPREAQREGFLRHIAAARMTQLPLVIHARDADDDIATILEEETGKGAFPFVLHCFSSGAGLARRGLALGGYVSFSGILTFKNSDAIRAIATEVPMARLLVETDAPYLAPPPHRGRRNEPAYVVETAKVLASVKGVDEAALAAATTGNFHRLFNKVAR